MASRINFLFYLLNLNDDELLSKFFEAQIDSPQSGDWILTVKEDLEHIGMTLSFEEIKTMKKDTFKNMVKKLITKAAFDYLLTKSESHSKMDNLHYEKLTLQSYLKSKYIKKDEAQKIFRFRTRMENFSENFKNGSESNQCLVCMEPDTLDNEHHFIKCDVLSGIIPEMLSLKHQELFTTTDTFNQMALKTLVKAMDQRKLLLLN